MKQWRLRLMALAGVLALPGTALAVDGPDRKRNISVQGQTGIMTYAGEAAEITNPGATYGVNIGVGVVPMLNAEIGYQGSVYRTEAGATPEQTTIMENGGQALLKLGPEMGNFRPYAAGGLSVMSLNVVDDEAAGAAVEDSTLVRLPVGLGFDYRFPSANPGDFTLGARGTYNIAVDSGAFPTLDNTASSSIVTGQVVLGGTW